MSRKKICWIVVAPVLGLLCCMFWVGTRASSPPVDDAWLSSTTGMGCTCTGEADNEGYDCADGGTPCAGCGVACSLEIVGGSLPKKCIGNDGTNKRCDKAGQVTCTTRITCKTTFFDNKTCNGQSTTATCIGLDGAVCGLCSNDRSTDEKLDTFVCNSI